VESHENWIEATRYLSMDLPKEHRKQLNHQASAALGCGSLSHSHDIPKLRRVNVLLESGQLFVFDVPDVAHLRVHALARCLVRSGITRFNNDTVPRGMNDGVGLLEKLNTIPLELQDAGPLHTSPGPNGAGIVRRVSVCESDTTYQRVMYQLHSWDGRNIWCQSAGKLRE
jgi:hypothetical protein